MKTIAESLGFATTCIGSLPHHNADAALAFSFQASLPFLPQIPIRNPWEYMIPQALEGLPGLQVENDGAVTLDLDVWLGRSRALNERLLAAFSSASRPDAFEGFEPSSAISSCWQPFLWELEERGARMAKVQIAGPLTSQWSLRIKDGSPVAAAMDRHPELGTQIFRLVLARAIAMCRRLRAGGIQPMIYLDEPGLYGFMATNPRHVLALQELRLLVQALRKEGALIGLHCCSDTDWKSVLALELDFLSLDAELSLEGLLAQKPALEDFLKAGGRLSLGVIPTVQRSHVPLSELEPKALFARLLETLGRAWADQPELARTVLREALFTPACGLALHSVSDAETTLAMLLDFAGYCRKSLS